MIRKSTGTLTIVDIIDGSSIENNTPQVVQNVTQKIQNPIKFYFDSSSKTLYITDNGADPKPIVSQ